jgi:hypothetical protein
MLSVMSMSPRLAFVPAAIAGTLSDARVKLPVPATASVRLPPANKEPFGTAAVKATLPLTPPGTYSFVIGIENELVEALVVVSKPVTLFIYTEYETKVEGSLTLGVPVVVPAISMVAPEKTPD